VVKPLGEKREKPPVFLTGFSNLFFSSFVKKGVDNMNILWFLRYNPIFVVKRSVSVFKHTPAQINNSLLLSELSRGELF
jgi:hypothetical protein